MSSLISITIEGLDYNWIISLLCQHADIRWAINILTCNFCIKALSGFAFCVVVL